MIKSSVIFGVRDCWTLVLDILGVPYTSHALPASTRCPLCLGHRLTIYEDTTSDAYWHYCFECYSRGSLLDLAAAVWKLDATCALRKLAILGMPIPQERLTLEALSHVEEHKRTYQRFVTLWERAQTNLTYTWLPSLNKVRRTLNLYHQFDADHWRSGPGKLVGALSHDAVEAAFAPGSLNEYGQCLSESRLFRGKGWADVLVIPFHDLPGRLCAFLFVGRNGDEKDMVFRRIYQESGLAWLDIACRHSRKGLVIAMQNTFLALRLQFRQAGMLSLPLPIVAWHSDLKTSTMQAWPSLGNCRPVFWDLETTTIKPDMLRQAMLSDGLISLTWSQTPAEEERLSRFIRHDPASVIVNRVLKKAKPWREAVKAWAAKVGEHKVEDLVLGLECYGLGQKLKDELGSSYAVTTAHQARTVLLNDRWTITEKDGCWYVKDKHGASSMVMNAILRVDRIFPRGKTPMLAGRLIYRDTTCTFEAPVTWFRHRAATYLAKLLLTRECALLFTKHRWSKRLFEIATLFHSPEQGLAVAQPLPSGSENDSEGAGFTV